jgi:hypothetical protein
MELVIACLTLAGVAVCATIVGWGLLRKSD